MSAQRTEYRLVIERDVPGDSRVMREEKPLLTEEAAREINKWTKLALFQGQGDRRWVQARTVTDWQGLADYDRERRGG